MSNSPHHDPYADPVLFEQVRMLHKQVPTSLIGGFFIALFIVVTMQHSQDSSLLAGWLSLTFFALLCRLLSFLRIKPDINDTSLLAWLKEFKLLLFLSSCIWGSGFWMLYNADNFLTGFALALSVCALLSGSVAPLSSHFPSYLWYTLPLMTLVSIKLLVSTTENDFFLPISLFIFWIVNLVYTKNMHASYTSTISLRYENDCLITQLRYKQEELENEHKISQKNADIAEKANREKTKFLAAASHDLAQPLQSLGLFLSALNLEENPEEQKKLLEKLHLCVNNMSELFSSLLDISKLDAEVVSPQYNSIGTMEILGPIIAEFEASTLRKGLKFEHNISVTRIWTDGSILQRIVRNLLSNAENNTARGHIGINATVTDSESLLVKIYDSGVGIHKDELNRIFEEFYQVYQSNDNPQRGFGLGLSIVKRLAAILDIELGLSSTVDKGTHLSFVVPLCRYRDLPLTQSSAAIANQSRKHVVIIDDEKLVRESMGAALRTLGMSVLTAKNAKTAISKMIENDFTPNLLVCDYRLQKSNTGLDAINQINEEFNRTFPAIVITGDTSAEILQAINETKITLLHKPVAMDVLWSEILSSLETVT